jgi:hypothetical protein
MANTTTALSESAPTNLLTTLPGWDTMPRKDQIYLEKETRALGSALHDFGQSRLAIGERLSNIQERLPKGMFTSYLKTFHFKRSTAYKHITSYKNAVQWMPDPILKVAMERNMPLLGEKDDEPLGVYTVSAKRLPPPKTEDKNKINQYLDTLEEDARKRSNRPKKAGVTESEDDLLKQAYRFIAGRLEKVTARRKRQFIGRLAGMLLSDIGVSQAQSFDPEAVPEEFVPVVGRPRKEQEEAA